MSNLWWSRNSVRGSSIGRTSAFGAGCWRFEPSPRNSASYHRRAVGGYPPSAVARPVRKDVAEAADSSSPPSVSPWRATIAALTVVGFAVPVAAYFWLIHHYAVNVVFLDQWSDVTLLGRSYSHTLTGGNLWAQHAEQRMLLPNLVMLLLGHVAHLNIVLEEYLSALMLCLAVALLIWTHKRRSVAKPWIVYCPVAILMLSPVQAQSTLFGFQLAWYAVILSLAATLFLLDRPRLSGPVLGAAIATALAGSLSSDQGLLIWACGLLLLYQRRRPLHQMIIWFGAAIVMGVVYGYGYDASKGVPPGLSGLDLPGDAVRSFFQVIGGVLGVHLQNVSGDSNDAVLLFGVVIFLIAIYALLTRGLRRDTTSGAPIGVGLICFGLVYAVAFANARAFAGPYTATTSQYTTFTILIVVGCYLALLDTPIRQGATATLAQRVAPVLGLVLLVAVCSQVLLGGVNGIREARSLHQRQIDVAGAVADIGDVPNPILQNAVGGYGIRPEVIRSDAEILKVHHLSFFDDQGLVTAYEAEARVEEKLGLFRYTEPPVTSVVRPTNGQHLQGTAIFDAVVRAGVPTTAVEFRLSGNGAVDSIIGSARRTGFEWSLPWKTTSLPDGSYEVQSVVFGRHGQIATSSPIVVEITNAKDARGGAPSTGS
jgi:hypothetical protein